MLNNIIITYKKKITRVIDCLKLRELKKISKNKIRKVNSSAMFSFVYTIIGRQIVFKN